MRRGLVTGFGPFPGVADNPSGALAQAVDGAVLGEVQIVGRVLPVSWSRGPGLAVALARDLDVHWVIGLGVATSRTRPEVELVAACAGDGRPDVDGICEAGLVGPEQLDATVDCEALATALGAGLSRDAGRYVCNAWLYRVRAALAVPVGFVHIPAAGMAPETLLRGLAILC